MRAGDERDLRELRRAADDPDARLVLEPGNVLVSTAALAVGVVVASALVVTLFDPQARRGGLCHFLRPRPPAGVAPTPLFGLPATAALVHAFLDAGAAPTLLVAGLYGAACPKWATAEQRAVARENVAVAREVLRRKQVAVSDGDVGGTRARKLWYLTSTNEILVAKTAAIRQSDWFPPLAAAAEARP